MYSIVKIKPPIVLRKIAKQYSACMLLIAATQHSRFDSYRVTWTLLETQCIFSCVLVSHALLSALYKTVISAAALSLFGLNYY